jgi:hypothetical protein
MSKLDNFQRFKALVKQIAQLENSVGSGNTDIVDAINNLGTTLAGQLALEVTASQINLNTDDLEKGVWEAIPGNSIEFTYYIDTGGGANPSGNKNVLTAIYKTDAGATTVVTQTYTWDTDDDVVSITAS